jgi:hypothetical protein
MQETVPAAMPKHFENWCRRFDDIFKLKVHRQQFRVYLGGLLSESRRKNLSVLAADTVNSSYSSLRHFLTGAIWEVDRLNTRRLEVMQQCRQTTPRKGFSLIIDDSGHPKSGFATAGVGRQYIGQLGKTDRGVVMVTTHLYDGVRSLPLDLALYQPASRFEQGKQAPEFIKKPELALQLIDQCLKRKWHPGVVVLDAGYGNNTPLLQQLDCRHLRYLASIAHNRVVYCQQDGASVKRRVDEVVRTLSPEAFTAVELPLDKPRTVWVTLVEVKVPRLEGKRWLAIQMSTATLEPTTEVDYFFTNHEQATPEWVGLTYSTRNWVEVFYREAKNWLGLTEYQGRDALSLKRHWILVFTAYTFILWHQLTGGLRRRWSTRALETFGQAFEAFRTAVEFRFVRWLFNHADVFASHKARFGFIWA